MRLFALIVFGIHMLFELAFGANAFLSGASSSQSVEQIAEQSVELTIAFRFLGRALMSLGVLAAIIIFVAGVQSVTARYTAIGFFAFHALGASGSVWSAAPGFEVYQQPLSLGALVLHTLLAVGFLIVALSRRDEALSPAA